MCRRENQASQSAELYEAFVERHQFNVGGDCERRQIGVVPEIGAVLPGLGEPLPASIQADGFFSVDDMIICEQLFVELPCMIQRNSIHWKSLAIRRKSKEAHLRYATETEFSLYAGSDPFFGGNVVRMRLKRQRQPNIGINELHLDRPKSDRSFHWLNARYLEQKRAPKEIQRAFDSEPAELRDPNRQRPLPVSHPATKGPRQIQPHRSEFVLKVSWTNYRDIARTSQQRLQRGGIESVLFVGSQYSPDSFGSAFRFHRRLRKRSTGITVSESKSSNTHAKKLSSPSRPKHDWSIGRPTPLQFSGNQHDFLKLTRGRRPVLRDPVAP